jgi:hypothetical protein
MSYTCSKKNFKDMHDVLYLSETSFWATTALRKLFPDETKNSAPIF